MVEERTGFYEAEMHILPEPQGGWSMASVHAQTSDLAVGGKSTEASGLLQTKCVTTLREAVTSSDRSALYMQSSRSHSIATSRFCGLATMSRPVLRFPLRSELLGRRPMNV